MEEWEIVKALWGAACLIGAWVDYQTMPGVVIRRRMLNCFKVGGLFLTKQGFKKEIKILPQVKKISFKPDFTQIRFSIPVGIDPEKIMKSEWIFQQTFG